MRKNVASQVIGAQLIAKADGTPVTTGTTNVYVTGDGGTQGGTGTATHEGNGFWTYLPTQAETNYTHVAFTFVNTNAINVTIQVYTTGYDPTAMVAQTGDSFARLGTPAGGSVSVDIAGVQSDTNDIQTRLPAALISGKMDSNAQVVADKTGYALSTAGVQAIWDALTSALTIVGSIGKLLVDNINATISSRSSHSAADVWAVGTRTLTSFGTLVSDIWSNSTRTLTAFSTGLALSVWDVLESAIATANSIGLKVINNLDAAVTSRQPSGNVTVGTNLDKTGYRLVTEIRNGTAQGGGATYITLDSGASTELNFYVGCLVVLPASGQARLITAYNGSTKVATIGPNSGWRNPIPNVGTAFTIIPAGYVQGINNGVTVTTNNDKWGYYLDYDLIGTGTAQGGTINNITLDIFASSIDDFYVGTLIILLYTGGAPYQARLITAYNGSTKVATVAPAWKVAPDATSVFFIKSAGAVNINSNSDITAIKTKTDTIVWPDVTDIKDEALGKWSINKTNNVKTMYKADGVTVLKTFNLTNNAAISERVPV